MHIHHGIGIIGGVGPEADFDLASKITLNTRAACDQEHLPVMVLSVPSLIADRSGYLYGTHALNAGRTLSYLADTLINLGAKYLAIPCNTAHAPEIFSLVQNTVGKRAILVHMIEETAKYTAQIVTSSSVVAVLSTLGTRKSQLYEKELQKKGINIFALAEEAQTVHDCIYNREYGIKAHSRFVHPTAKKKLEAVLNGLQDKGCTHAILGCTELPLAFSDESYTRKSTQPFTLIDPTSVVARRLIASFDREKLTAE